MESIAAQTVWHNETWNGETVVLAGDIGGTNANLALVTVGSGGFQILVEMVFPSQEIECVIPAIRSDCKDPSIEVVATGPSIGAFNALAAICRHPDVFSSAICMSGTYDLSKFLEGEVTDDYYHSSPLHFVPNMPDGELLAQLRERFVLITHGTGKWEEPEQSWRVADLLGARGIPNRVDEWGTEWNHDWPTWRNMLPQYLDEVLSSE